MGALFELLAELIVAITIATLAQIGVSLDAPSVDAPSIQRTVVRTAPPMAPHTVADEDCPEAARLQSA